MTICSSLSLESMVFTLIVAVIVPSVIIYFIHKKLKPKTKSLFVLFSIVAFIILFFVIAMPLFQFFTPPCGPGIFCVPFEFYAENNTCNYGNEIISNTVQCNQLQERYISQIQTGKKYCSEGSITDQF